MGVVVRRYIDFLILLIPTPLVSVLFCSSIPTFCSFKKIFFVLVIDIRSVPIINPRRACARVTVLVLSVCLCVCVFSLFWHLAQSGVQTAVSATSARYGHEI